MQLTQKRSCKSLTLPQDSELSVQVSGLDLDGIRMSTAQPDNTGVTEGTFVPGLSPTTLYSSGLEGWPGESSWLPRDTQSVTNHLLSSISIHDADTMISDLYRNGTREYT